MPQRVPPKRTTIYDLAKLAGTSASAVSAVLNGNWKKRRISEALAQRVQAIADEQGYFVNKQARALRRERSRIIGMIVPKYDNRYFGSIVEQFETMARDRGFFPIITCTRRDPELEVEATRELLSYQVECIVATGATDPDRISALCAAAGTRSLNLDLPGTRAPSIISDNHRGALELTREVLFRNRERFGLAEPLIFVGGRSSDHNTVERIRGFRAAHAEARLAVREDCILPCGYAAEKAELAMQRLYDTVHDHPRGMIVNSTISLEGVLRWIHASQPDLTRSLTMGCFDWDPLVEYLSDNVLMVRQDVTTMLQQLWAVHASGRTSPGIVEVAPIHGWRRR